MKEKPIVKETMEKELSPYKDFPFLVYCLLCAIFSVCFFQFFNTIPIFYKEVAHLDQKSIGYILGYSGFIIVVLEMLVVNFADKYLTIAKTLLYGILMCSVAYAMLAINHHISLILLSISILSVGEILVLPFMSTITALRSGKTNQGAYMGLNGMTFSISFIITPLLGTSVASDLGFNTLWIGSGVVLALAGIAMYFVVNWLLPDKVKTAH